MLSVRRASSVLRGAALAKQRDLERATLSDAGDGPGDGASMREASLAGRARRGRGHGRTPGSVRTPPARDCRTCPACLALASCPPRRPRSPVACGPWPVARGLWLPMSPSPQRTAALPLRP